MHELVHDIQTQLNIIPQVTRWIFISAVVGILSGSASAFFLWSLDLVTEFRMHNSWLLYALPVSGLFIAFLFQKFGKEIESGNNLLIDEIHSPKKTVPLRMAPLILLGTLASHLCGGSVGREGTAVQMGGSLADQLTQLFRLDSQKRKILLMAGISAGFASVFGTPLAGAIFGLEVLSIGKVRYQAILPCFIAAIMGDFICRLWGIHHTTFWITEVPLLSIQSLLFSLIAGGLFGLCALLFSRSSHFLTKIFKLNFPSPYLRVAIGGVVFVILTLAIQTDRYLGLSIPTLTEAFQSPVPFYDFALKTFFTVLMLSSGFKGGEVTPLFFIGATLGNLLSRLLPLPLSLLSGMGFTAVFAGAANTPLACIVLSMELFGSQAGIYMSIACVMSYLFSGQKGIYHSQKMEEHKHA